MCHFFYYVILSLCWLAFYSTAAENSEINVTLPTPVYYEALRAKGKIYL